MVSTFGTVRRALSGAWGAGHVERSQHHPPRRRYVGARATFASSKRLG
jgi:hypothetical protein